MITTKQRAYLRGLANSIDTILQIGKGGINEQTIKQTRDALLARELVKMRVLETSPISSREAAQDLAEKINADIVQVIGTKFVLYKRNDKNPVVHLSAEAKAKEEKQAAANKKAAKIKKFSQISKYSKDKKYSKDSKPTRYSKDNKPTKYRKDK